MITTGSQQGLDLIASVFLDPGDVVLVELPSYTGAITAFRNVQASLVGVRQQQDGIDLDDLERRVNEVRREGRPLKFLYLVPNFQNPTGLLISLEKRRRLLELAARHDILIVEDDPYGALYFEDTTEPEDTRPIKADDRDGRVVYLSSFSKTLTPGVPGGLGDGARRPWSPGSRPRSSASTCARATSISCWCSSRSVAACSTAMCHGCAATTRRAA